MAHDMIAFYESNTGSATFDNVAGLADAHVTVSGDNITMPWIIEKGAPTPPSIMYAMAGLTNISDMISACQLSAPSLRGRTLLDVPTLNQPYSYNVAAGAYHPNTASATYIFPPGQEPISWFMNSPLQLVPGENLQAQVISTGTTAACLETIVVGLGNGNYGNPYAGMSIETLRYTAGATLVAHAWTNAALTTTQTLRYGRYAIVGMKYFGATAQAARLVLPETPHRPGCIGVTGRGDSIGMFRQGNLGVYGEFTSTNLPTVDYLANAADSAQVVYLDVVKIA